MARSRSTGTKPRKAAPRQAAVAEDGSVHIEPLLSRASVNALGEPGPGDAELRLILRSRGSRARPWAFAPGVSSSFAARRAGVSANSSQPLPGGAIPLFPKPSLKRNAASHCARPVTIVVAAKLSSGHKNPEIEQVLSAAAAAMNILNAAHALGFGAKWVTGANCYDRGVPRRHGPR